MARVNGTKHKSEHADGRRMTSTRHREGRETGKDVDPLVHVLGPGIVCDTENRGHAMPDGRAPADLVLDASEGFIPLWEPDVTLRWRFRERSMRAFANPAGAKAEMRRLFAEALLRWGDAAPVKFAEDPDVYDFEIVMRASDECSASGCVLASAFFPDGGRHEFVVYPKMFTQSRKEQVDTFIHETGHVFGLRHFFAPVAEARWRSEIFGTNSQFSIMNYGVLSELTPADRFDLKRLYRAAWDGDLSDVNGTPIRLVRPYHMLAGNNDEWSALAPAAVVCPPRRTPARMAYAPLA